MGVDNLLRGYVKLPHVLDLTVPLVNFFWLDAGVGLCDSSVRF